MHQPTNTHPSPRHLPIPIHWAFFTLIFLCAAWLRFTNLNWDEGQWIHPDEGHMRLITWTIHTPDRATLYFDTRNSPLNATNGGHTYNYGTLPLFMTRFTAEWLERGCGESPDRLAAMAGRLLIRTPEQPCPPDTFTFDYSALIGRFFSALADIGTLLLVYGIGRRLFGRPVGLLAMMLYALTAFAIQQAHFFTVDSMASFFTLLTAYFSVRAAEAGTDRGPSWGDFGLAGIATGLAVACKISAGAAALFVVLAGVRWGLRALGRDRSSQAFGRVLWAVAPRLILAGLLALLAFRIAQPYAFEGPGFTGIRPNPEWFDRLRDIVAEQNGTIDAPPGQQWANRPTILFPWLNMVVWGMGLPLGLAAWAAWAAIGVELLRGRHDHLVLWGWASIVFIYLATRWTMTGRYFLPLYPVLAVMTAYALVRLCRAPARWLRAAGIGAAVLVLLGAMLWARAFFSIYLRPHTRVAASRWIYANVPAGATVANEHWDWGLPLRIDGQNPFRVGLYKGIELALYDADTPEKRAALLGWLDRTDWIFIASNRLYASIPRLGPRYPLAVEYYRALFAGDLGFELVVDFTSYPAIGPFQFPDQENRFPLTPAAYASQRNPIVVQLPPAEESFGVYDHPRVLIFRKTPAYSHEQVEVVLGRVDLSRVAHDLTPKVATAPCYLRLHQAGIYLELALVLVLGLALFRRGGRVQ